jgi:hypothetical protein
MSNGVPQVVPSTACPVLPPSQAPFPAQPTPLWGGYPPANPRSAWSNFAPPPTGCVYGLDGSTKSWVPVVTRWEVMCMLEENGQTSIGEAPGTGFNYVRNGLTHSWVDVQSLTFDGGVY